MGNVMTSVAERPVTEVTEKAKRRRFTAEYRQRILREAAACTRRGEVGALLRREGLYSSHLTIWRQQAEQAERAALTPKKRGPKPKAKDERDKRIAELERQNAKLTRRAERAQALVEVQKKVSQLLGIALPTPPSEEDDS
jgi:transposase-like protein